MKDESMHVEPANLSDRGTAEELTGRPDPDIGDLDTSAGTVIASSPVRFLGRIRGQEVIRELPDGRLESATYPLYAVRGEGGRPRASALQLGR